VLLRRRRRSREHVGVVARGVQLPYLESGALGGGRGPDPGSRQGSHAIYNSVPANGLIERGCVADGDCVRVAQLGTRSRALLRWSATERLPVERSASAEAVANDSSG
jgi:hypothetical protein